MRSLGLSEELYKYVAVHGAREHAVLAELRAATAPLRHAGMQIGADQGAFMQLLVKMVRAKRTIEIGVFTGYSSLAVALALPPDGQVIACDVSEEWTRIAREHWKKAGVEKKIELVLAGFPTQAGKPWFTADLFRAVARIRGMECVAPERVAEAFYCRKLVI